MPDKIWLPTDRPTDRQTARHSDFFFEEGIIIADKGEIVMMFIYHYFTVFQYFDIYKVV